MTGKPRHKNKKNTIKEGYRKHPTLKTLLDLYKRRLTMQETLRIFEHTSKCRDCYKKLKKIMTDNTKTKSQ